MISFRIKNFIDNYINETNSLNVENCGYIDGETEEYFQMWQIVINPYIFEITELEEKIKVEIFETTKSKRVLLAQFLMENNKIFNIQLPIVQDTYYIQRFFDKFPKIAKLIDVKFVYVYSYGFRLMTKRNESCPGEYIANLEFSNEVSYRKR